MRHELSILIPTYNDSCTEIVTQLDAQAAHTADLKYEIIIADDGSTDEETRRENQKLSALEHCKLYRFEKNRGRAAIRNSLVEFADYEWLLFIDSGHMRLCADDYLKKYLCADDEWQVVYGGYRLSEPKGDKKSNLRYLYELANKQNSSAALRGKAPNYDFHSSNFLAHKSIFSSVSFDERFVRYGYEDVVMGKNLAAHGITVCHLDNPTLFCNYEDNASFLRKTIEALQTLKEFEAELHDFSRLTHTARLLCRMGLAPVVRHLYRSREEQWRANLCGRQPSLTIFNLFRLGNYLTL